MDSGRGAELEPKMKSKIPSNPYLKHSEIFAFSYSLQAQTTQYLYTADLCVCNIFLMASPDHLEGFSSKGTSSLRISLTLRLN